MRIKIIAGNCPMYPTLGQIVEVSEKEASHLIGNGRAEETTEEAKRVTMKPKKIVKSDNK